MAKREKGSAGRSDQIKLPQGFENLQNDGWGARLSGWSRRNFSSVILPVIALIILGGGIYLYSQQQGPAPLGETAAPETGGELGAIGESETAETGLALGEESGSTGAATTRTITVPGANRTAVISSDTSARFVGDNIEVAATPGEGITHLARRCLAMFLQERASAELRSQLTPEHKIYIEDYLQNRTGDFSLQLNEQLTFSTDLVQEAIDAALGLSDAQLHNLEQFSQLVPSLT